MSFIVNEPLLVERVGYGGRETQKQQVEEKKKEEKNVYIKTKKKKRAFEGERDSSRMKEPSILYTKLSKS